MPNLFEKNLDRIRAKKPFMGNFQLDDEFPLSFEIPEFKEQVDEHKIWTWDEALPYLDTHPADLLDRNDTKQRFFCKSAHERESTPTFAKEVFQRMRTVFPQNHITNIIFMGLGPDSESYPMHTDTMDVFLVQAIGTVKIIVEGFLGDADIDLYAGDFIYIPRGTAHQILPQGSRVTMSFGVEQDPDPATYV